MSYGIFLVQYGLVNKGFWEKLSFPVVGLSPMDGVTDAACRFMAKKHGKSDVSYTEFVSAEGLWRINERGDREHRIWKELIFDETERPVIAQIFGSEPESFTKAAKIVGEMGFDGIDINMGCPSPGLEKREGGAGLMRNKERAARVIEATRKGIKEAGRNIPVSVKTRLGSAEVDPSWWEFLATQKLAAVAMHGRTFKQLYSGKADWESLKKAGKVIKKSGALFLANGDISQIEMNGDETLAVLSDGEKIQMKGWCDGVLIGRWAIGNPWVLRKDGYAPGKREKLEAVLEHARKHEEFFGEKGFAAVRKHLAGYVKGMDDATELRSRLVLADNSANVEEIIKNEAEM